MHNGILSQYSLFPNPYMLLHETKKYAVKYAIVTTKGTTILLLCFDDANMNNGTEEILLQ